MPPSSKAELRLWLKEDLKGYVQDGVFPGGTEWRWWHPPLYPLIAWQRLLRKTEFVVCCRTGAFWKPWVLFHRWRFVRKSIRLNLEIPINVFGPGLTVVHYGNIVVNPKVRVGRNCRIHPGVCLGELHNRNPRLGDDVYLGNGAMVIGDLQIGDAAKIGPHALVRHSVEPGGVVVSAIATPVSQRKAADLPDGK